MTFFEHIFPMKRKHLVEGRREPYLNIDIPVA
jgi:hypothetical protein